MANSKRTPRKAKVTASARIQSTAGLICRAAIYAKAGKINRAGQCLVQAAEDENAFDVLTNDLAVQAQEDSLVEELETLNEEAPVQADGETPEDDLTFPEQEPEAESSANSFVDAPESVAALAKAVAKAGKLGKNY